MSAGHDHAHDFDGMNDDYKRRLMLVTGINVAMFFVEMSAGAVSGSQALKADALDFFADGLTYALSFWAIGRAANVRTGAAVLKGASLLLMGLWISSRVADRIASPIVTLTAFTRGFRQGESSLPALPSRATAEVDELHRAYAEMIQALEQSREQIVRAGKPAVVGEMAAIMAHEVRTPLGILRNSAQLLQRQPELGEREQELIGYIFSETERLNCLVTLLLECARPTPPDFRPHDLHAIIDAVLNLLASRAEKAGVALSWVVPLPWLGEPLAGMLLVAGIALGVAAVAMVMTAIHTLHRAKTTVRLDRPFPIAVNPAQLRRGLDPD